MLVILIANRLKVFVDITNILVRFEASLIPLSALQLSDTLRYCIIILLRILCLLHYNLSLLGHEINLVTLLRLNSPGHFQLPPIVRKVGISVELRREPRRIHRLFNTVNDADDVVDVSLEVLPFLQAVHGDQVSFLVGDGVQVSCRFFLFFDGLPFRWRFVWATRFFWRNRLFLD
jgi:hypothetical protein